VRGPLEEAEVRPAVELGILGNGTDRHRRTGRILEQMFDSWAAAIPSASATAMWSLDNKYVVK